MCANSCGNVASKEVGKNSVAGIVASNENSSYDDSGITDEQKYPAGFWEAGSKDFISKLKGRLFPLTLSYIGINFSRHIGLCCEVFYLEPTIEIRAPCATTIVIVSASMSFGARRVGKQQGTYLFQCDSSFQPKSTYFYSIAKFSALFCDSIIAHGTSVHYFLTLQGSPCSMCHSLKI